MKVADRLSTVLSSIHKDWNKSMGESHKTVPNYVTTMVNNLYPRSNLVASVGCEKD